MRLKRIRTAEPWCGSPTRPRVEAPKGWQVNRPGIAGGLRLLRRSHDKQDDEQIFTRGPGSCGSDGSGSCQRVPPRAGRQ
jgi:hypothetical protein